MHVLCSQLERHDSSIVRIQHSPSVTLHGSHSQGARLLSRLKMALTWTAWYKILTNITWKEMYFSISNAMLDVPKLLQWPYSSSLMTSLNYIIRLKRSWTTIVLLKKITWKVLKRCKNSYKMNHPQIPKGIFALVVNMTSSAWSRDSHPRASVKRWWWCNCTNLEWIPWNLIRQRSTQTSHSHRVWSSLPTVSYRSVCCSGIPGLLHASHKKVGTRYHCCYSWSSDLWYSER